MTYKGKTKLQVNSKPVFVQMYVYVCINIYYIHSEQFPLVCFHVHVIIQMFEQQHLLFSKTRKHH